MAAQAQSARTDGNIRWAVPGNRQYNGNPGASDWGPTFTERTTEFFDPQPYCLEMTTDGRTQKVSPTEYDSEGNPYCLMPGDPDGREAAQVDFDPNSPINRQVPRCPRGQDRRRELPATGDQLDTV